MPRERQQTTSRPDQGDVGIIGGQEALAAAWDRWFESVPADIKAKLSFHDLKRIAEAFKVAFRNEDAMSSDQNQTVQPIPSEPFYDRFEPIRGGYVEVGSDNDFVTITLPSEIGLTPGEARRLARSLSRIADEIAP